MDEQQKHPGGRPRIELDLRQVEELARIGCTEADMSTVLGVSVDTIQRRKRSYAEFRGVIEKGQASLRNSLRRLQVKKALEGNVTMLIWLGKQLLGQTDRQAVEHTGANGERLVPQQAVAEVDEETRQLLRQLRARLPAAPMLAALGAPELDVVEAQVEEVSPPGGQADDGNR